MMVGPSGRFANFPRVERLLVGVSRPNRIRTCYVIVSNAAQEVG